MATLRRRDTFRIDAHEMVGNRLKVQGHFSRTGIQTYQDGMGGTRREYRDPSEVFAQTSLDSLAGMPVTVRHPVGVGGRVTPQNWRKLASDGVVVGNTGDAVTKADDAKHTLGTIWVHDDATILKIQRRELRELSVGYTAQLDTTPGTSPEGERYDARQTNIQGNHIALLGGGEARGGPTVNILDAQGHARFDDDSDTPQENTKMKHTFGIEGYDYVVELDDSSNLPQAWEKLQAKIKADAESRETLQAKLDALTEEKAELQTKLDAALDPVAQAEQAKARNKLLADAKIVAGKDVEDKGAVVDIKRSALEARGLKLDGKSETYIEIRFDGIVEDAPEQPREDAADKLRGNGAGSIKVELTPEQKSFTSMRGGR